MGINYLHDFQRAGGPIHTSQIWAGTKHTFGAFVRPLSWGLTVGAISGGPEARFIPADWGNTPGMETAMLLRWDEGPTHPNGKTIWREFRAFIGTLPHVRYV